MLKATFALHGAGCYHNLTMTTQREIIVYTRPDCSYSDALIEELDAEGVKYTEFDLVRRPDKVAEVLKLTGGERITPVMVQGDVVTVGFRGVG